MLQALSWAGASPFAYGAGLADWLAFLLGSLAITVVVFRALRNVKLFADREVVGRVDFMGGTTICPRSELAEIRVVWRWILPSRGSFAHWGAPVLHVRRRDMTEAFVTQAILYRSGDLEALGTYLGLPIDVDHPPADLAA